MSFSRLHLLECSQTHNTKFSPKSKMSLLATKGQKKIRNPKKQTKKNKSRNTATTLASRIPNWVRLIGA